MQKQSPILLALVVVLNILENKKPANHSEKLSAILLVLIVVLNILENKKPANNAETKSTILLALVVVLNILESKKASKPRRKIERHFVSPSCRAQHPGNKKPANNAETKSTILLALVVVLNILENKKPANHAERKHFVSASCRAQHPGKQEASKPCRKHKPHFVTY